MSAPFSKGEVIERLLKSHQGNVSSEDIVTEAAAYGCETTVAYVRLVRSNLTSTGQLPRMRQKHEAPVAPKRRKHGQPNAIVPVAPAPAPIAAAPPAPKSAVTGDFTVEELLAVKRLSQQFGGAARVNAALKTLDTLAKLAS